MLDEQCTKCLCWATQAAGPAGLGGMQRTAGVGVRGQRPATAQRPIFHSTAAQEVLGSPHLHACTGLSAPACMPACLHA